MKTLLTAQSLAFDVASGPLFSDISLTLEQGQKIGLLGHNGSGKSTLLKLLDGTLEAQSGQLAKASDCVLARVEQALPAHLQGQRVTEALLACLPLDERDTDLWRVQAQLDALGFDERLQQLPCHALSGGWHTRLLLARALLCMPDLLLLDEPSNHLDLPTLMWLERFLAEWRGSFLLVSHDQHLLDAITNSSWILRDNRLHCFALPCSAARQALAEQDRQALHRRAAEQREIDRVAESAKRLAVWGRTYDNKAFARKAKTMERRVARLTDAQTETTQGLPWTLLLQGESITADSLVALSGLAVLPSADGPALFVSGDIQLKSGDRVAVIGRNGAGKSSLLKTLWRCYHSAGEDGTCRFNPRVRLGYYDQSLQQLNDEHSLIEALEPYARDLKARKQALITAGFGWQRQQQQVALLSGGERARLLFVGLSLARYSLLMLDEPTNHLDMEGREALARNLAAFEGAVLVVSHDRAFLEQTCNRFWLVEHGLEEMVDIGAAEDRFIATEGPRAADTAPEPPAAESAGIPSLVNDDEQHQDALLARLVELEALLAADRARKPKHQKPERQRDWQRQIDELLKQLE